jgi:hypothetical protein
MREEVERFLEVSHHQIFKYNQSVGGDVFYCRKLMNDKRVIAILADGLGSGIKASVLAHLTTAMAGIFISNDIDITRAANIIMRTLPRCQQRNLAYCTFSIIDIDILGSTRIIEFDNPPAILFRNGAACPIHRETLLLDSPSASLHYSEFQTAPGDLIVLLTDGLIQAGMGASDTPTGWGHVKLQRYLERMLSGHSPPETRQIARTLTQKASQLDQYQPSDDMTVATLSIRHPKRLLVVTGPPYDESHDSYMASEAALYSGKKVICGGTTAEILSRHLCRKSIPDPATDTHELPPASRMEGFDLVTEGILTLSRALWDLQSRKQDFGESHAAAMLCTYFMESDQIDFLVGTRINPVHYAPHISREIEVRRSLIRQICEQLETVYLKKTTIEFI